MHVEGAAQQSSLVRTITIVGRRTRGYRINVYREGKGLRLVRRGRYRRVTLGSYSVEWYPA